MCKKIARTCLFLATLWVLGVSQSATATVISLGTVSSPATLSFGNDGLLEPFADAYLFTISAGKTFDFSSFISTGYVRVYGIEEFAGSLFNSSGLISNGISSTRYLPEGFPAFDVSFLSIVLGAGDYTLQLTGRPYSVYGAGAAYSGTATFSDATTSVAEPGSLALMGLALAGLGLSRRRRQVSRLRDLARAI